MMNVIAEISMELWMERRLPLLLRGLSEQRAEVKDSQGQHWVSPFPDPLLYPRSPLTPAPVEQGRSELLPKAGTSFPRHLLKPLNQNSPVFSWLLNPAFLLFIMLDRNPMQMLYFGRMSGR